MCFMAWLMLRDQGRRDLFGIFSGSVRDLFGISSGFVAVDSGAGGLVSFRFSAVAGSGSVWPLVVF